jgi:hypothetical protein
VGSGDRIKAEKSGSATSSAGQLPTKASCTWSTFGSGAEHAVHLFDLAPAGDATWSSASPHVCRADCYSADMVVHPDRIELAWSIRGPGKNESVGYEYALAESLLA